MTILFQTYSPSFQTYTPCSSDVNQQNSIKKDVSKTFETTEDNCEDGLFEVLKKVRASNVNRFGIGHLNINFIRYKFDMSYSIVKDNINVLMVSEKKLDSSFPRLLQLHSNMIEILMVEAFSFL